MGPSFVDDKKHPNVDPRLAKSHVVSPISSSAASDFLNTSPTHSVDKAHHPHNNNNTGSGGSNDDVLETPPYSKENDPTSLHAYHYHHQQFEALLQEEIDHYIVLEGGGTIGDDLEGNTGGVDGDEDGGAGEESANMVFSTNLMYSVLHPDVKAPLIKDDNTSSPRTPNSLEGISLHGI
jgi:hypothetical protein